MQVETAQKTLPARIALIYIGEMIEYDEDVLRKYASRLYSQALILMFVWGLMGVAVGFIVQAIVPAVLPRSRNDWPALQDCLLVASAIVGLVLGWAKYQELRIKAQQILCQVEIEANTRALAQPKIERRRIA